jgi:hypothetical protein
MSIVSYTKNIEGTSQMTEKYWGLEAVLDVRGCDLSKVSNPDVISEFAKELVVRLDMEPYGEPNVVHFGKEEKAGWTLVQLITTSNIVAHFNDCDGSCYLNVFSCKHFEPETVVQCVEDFFTPEHISVAFLIRNAHA